MNARKLAAAVLLAVSALTLAGCGDDDRDAESKNLRPFVQLTPSGAEVICTWNNWNGRDGNEWECEAIRD